MKKLVIVIVLLGFFYFYVAGCTAGIIYVEKKPPALKVIKPIGSKPFKNAVWISGYWQFNNKTSDFVWVTGQWTKAHQGKIWVAGHWVQKPKGWVYVKGHWTKK